MITHNLSDAIHFGNRLIVMHRGEIVRDFAKRGKSSINRGRIIQINECPDEADLQGE